MEEKKFHDLTTLFRSLQGELTEAGIGQARSLKSQLRLVEDDLQSYFKNRTHLTNCLRTGGLTYEHAYLKRTHPWSASLLSELLREYQEASNFDDGQLLLSLARFFSPIGRAYEHLASAANLAKIDTHSDVRVLAKACFRSIGDVIESSLFAFLKLRLNIQRIASGKSIHSADFNDLTLGKTVEELALTDDRLYSPEPFGVRLSQWRNIAHHSSYQVNEEKIRCWYGNQGRHKFECTPSDLVAIAKYVDDVYYLHKVAFEVFTIDNAKQVIEFSGTSGEEYEALNIDDDFNTDTVLAYSIVASGFHIINAGRNGFRWEVLLEDRHGRSKDDLEATLKASLLSYLFQVKSLHIQAIVRSRGANHFMSFEGNLKKLKP